MNTFIAVNKCEHGNHVVSLDDDGGGLAFARPKCGCRRYDVVERIPIDAGALRDMAIEFECMADRLDAV